MSMHGEARRSGQCPGHLLAYSAAEMPGVTSPAAIRCGWLSGAGCASRRRSRGRARRSIEARRKVGRTVPYFTVLLLFEAFTAKTDASGNFIDPLLSSARSRPCSVV